jgi:uncharacterized protein (DUF305 family)
MSTSLEIPAVNLTEVVVTNDPDIDFARHMKLYYSAGLKGAEIELRNGRKEEVKRIAEEQFNHHEKDIQLFDDYVHNQEPKLSDPVFIQQFYAEIERKKKIVSVSENFDVQYLTLLIKHHEEAILLCELYLKRGTDPFLKLKAKHIISDHKPEIEGLKTLLNTLTST